MPVSWKPYIHVWNYKIMTSNHGTGTGSPLGLITEYRYLRICMARYWFLYNAPTGGSSEEHAAAAGPALLPHGPRRWHRLAADGDQQPLTGRPQAGAHSREYKPRLYSTQGRVLRIWNERRQDAVLRIRHILVRIRILLFSPVTLRMATKKNFSSKFKITFWNYIYIFFQRLTVIKKSVVT